MAKTQTTPYGSWNSPITGDLVVAGTIRLGKLCFDGGALYWTEGRPREGGRDVLVRRTADGTIRDITPSEFNVRTRVHEYGGGAYVVDRGTVFFANFADQHVYRQKNGEDPSRLTNNEKIRYADFAVDRMRNRLVCVREDHSMSGREATTTLAAIPMEGKPSDGDVLVSGNDFYSSPRVHPDGTKLAWLTWNHPNMPWDGTELWVGEFSPAGTVINSRKVAGGLAESIFQPEWSPDGTLYFVSDRTGWWNIYRWENDMAEAVTALDAEFGVPQWLFGPSTYAFTSDTQICCTYCEDGVWRLATLDTRSKRLTPVDTEFTDFHSIVAGDDAVAFVAGSPTQPMSVVQFDPGSGTMNILRESTTVKVSADYLSIPQSMEYPTENGLTAHGFFYPPKNPDCEAPSDERPPLLVMSHGGPTSATSAVLNLSVQFWTSRGIAVLDVNYGGSTGYGRAYRGRLRGNWGIVDLDDCVNGVLFLANQGKIDGNRAAIRGGSAGGYTTLAALTFRNTFRVGASYYGVSDLGMLARETHKFESRYLDSMVGPYPERKNIYDERSPLFYTDQLSCPIIFFQGLEDKVVPPNQAELMVEQLREKGIPVAYVPFEGEGHGFRRAENIKRALEAELYFYSRVLGFELPEPIEPVHIDNL